MFAPLSPSIRGAAHLLVVNPLKRRSLAGLFSTQPPIEERVRRRRAMQPRVTA